MKPDSLIVGGILLMLGWYASPFQSLDTLFTQTLSRLGLEELWSVLFSAAGGLKITVTLWQRNCPRGLIFAANWSVAIITIWTGMIFSGYGPLTPTTAACWVIGVGSLLSLWRNARQARKIRIIYGARTESPG